MGDEASAPSSGVSSAVVVVVGVLSSWGIVGRPRWGGGVAGVVVSWDSAYTIYGLPLPYHFPGALHLTVVPQYGGFALVSRVGGHHREPPTNIEDKIKGFVF